MALEDVVQGVKVNVSTDGVDDATSKIGQLDKAIGDLSKTAGDAAQGGGGAQGGGIGGLTKAFSDLNTTGAEAFAQIARQASSGDLTGLATLFGGKIAGGVVEAGKALGEFMEAQTEAGIRNAAMAKQFGTTPAVMQDMKEGFASAGVSGESFSRLISRMSRQVQTDYPEMQRNVQESNLKSAKSALDLEEAHRAVIKSFSDNTPQHAAINLAEAQERLQIARGVPKEVFEMQDRFRDQQKAELAVSDALEKQDDANHNEQLKRKRAQIELQEQIRKQHEEELKDIPHIAQELQNSANAAKQSNDIQDTGIKTLRQSIEYMVSPSGPAKGFDVLHKEMELIHQGAIEGPKALELMQESMGRGEASGAGLHAMSAQDLVDTAQRQGPEIMDRAQANKGTISQLGLGQTNADTGNFKQFAGAVSEAAGIWSALMQKLGAFAASSIGVPAVKTFAEFGEAITNMIEGVQKMFGGNQAEGMRQLLHGGRQLTDAGGQGTTSGEFVVDKGFEERTKEAEEYNRTHGGAGAQYQEPGTPNTSGNSDFIPGTNQRADHGFPDWYSRGQPSAASVDDGGISAALKAKAAEISAVQIPAVAGSPAGAPVLAPVITTNAPTPAGYRGGAVRIPGYARGGVVSNIPGYAEGGIAGTVGAGIEPLIAQAVQKFGPRIMDTVKQYDLSTDEGRSKLNELVVGTGLERWGEHGIEKGLEKAGVDMAGGLARAALGVTVGVLTNPFGVGLLDASPTAAADYTSGAHTEEAAGRAMGASNAAEAAQMRAQGRDIPMWQGGFIRGFADGGGIRIPSFAMGGDEISQAEEEVADAELAVQQDPKSKSAKDNLAIAKNKLAKLKASEGAGQRAEHNQDRARQEQERQQAAAEKQAAQQKAADQQESLRSQKLGGTGWGDNMKSPGLMASPPSYNDPYAGIFGGANSPGAAVESPSGGVSPPLAPEPEPLPSGTALWQGGIPGFAMGSIKGPGSDTSDSILARLSNGEFVMKAAAVRSYGEGFMHAVNNMQIPPPKYERGGMVPASSLPHFAEGGPMERAGSTLNLHIGNESFNGLKAPAAVADQLRKYAVGQQTSATGKKPSWAGG